MLIHAKCKKCGNEGLIDIGDLSIEAAVNVLSKGTSQCTFGEQHHQEVIPPAELFELDWDNPVEQSPMTDEMFKEELESRVGEVFTKEELGKKYNIESFAYGACLCTEKDSEQLVLFNFSTSPSGKRLYFKV